MTSARSHSRSKGNKFRATRAAASAFTDRRGCCAPELRGRSSAKRGTGTRYPRRASAGNVGGQCYVHTVTCDLSTAPRSIHCSPRWTLRGPSILAPEGGRETNKDSCRIQDASNRRAGWEYRRRGSSGKSRGSGRSPFVWSDAGAGAKRKSSRENPVDECRPEDIPASENASGKIRGNFSARRSRPRENPLCVRARRARSPASRDESREPPRSCALAS